MIERVKRRVRKLLATAAPDSGATEAERSTARRLADFMLREHGIREGDAALPQPRPLHPYVSVVVGGRTSGTANEGCFRWSF